MIFAFFLLKSGASPDNKESGTTICQISQGGIGLPDRDYYFDEDKEEKRNAYKLHIAKMLSLIKDPTTSSTDVDEEMITIANQIYELELKLAEGHMTKTENRDPEATYNKMNINELTKSFCDDEFHFPSYFMSATNKSIEELGDINVRNVKAITTAVKIIHSLNNGNGGQLLKNYLHWRSIRSCATYLTKAFVDEDFNFNENILAGTNEIKPRWKRAMAFTESALGEALGQMYCAKYFDESCKQKALFIVESVRQSLEDRLKEIDFIKAESTREQALKKMSRFNVKIGYPDKWIDYSTLDIQEGEPFMNMVFKSRVFDQIRQVKEMNAPTDKDKWFMHLKWSMHITIQA